MGLVPVSEIGPQLWNVQLPEYVDDTRIGLHIGRLHTMARLAGFGASVRIGSYEGETTQYNPMVVGGDSQGNAYAGVGGVRLKRRGEGEAEDHDHSLWSFMHARPALHLRVNTTEITQRMGHEGSRVRDPAAWSRHLNGAIGEGLRQASWEHQVRSMQFGELGLTAVGQALGAIEGQGLGNMLFRAVLSNTVSRFMAVLIFERERTTRDMCWSLLPGVHPDRALALSGMSRAFKVVKPLSQP